MSARRLGGGNGFVSILSNLAILTALSTLAASTLAFAGGGQRPTFRFFRTGENQYPATVEDPKTCSVRLHTGLDLPILPPDVSDAADFVSQHHARLAGDTVDMRRIGEDVAILSGELPINGTRRIPDRALVKNREIARKFIRERLQTLGYEVRTEDFKVEKKIKTKKKETITEFTGTNLYCEIPGTVNPEQVIEVSAHYDTAKGGVPGADDNGSGLASVLEMARLLRGFTPEKTIRFVFPDLEEKGLLGTQYHAMLAKRRGDAILGAVVVDMIGYYPAERGYFVMEVGTPDDFKRFPEAYQPTRDLANEILFQYLSYNDRRTGIHPATVDALPSTGDHGAYWMNGYPAVLVAAPFSDDLTNPNYHKSTDRMNVINWNYLGDIARYVTEGVACMANAKACPGSLTAALHDRDWYFGERHDPRAVRGANYIPPDPPKRDPENDSDH